VAAFLALTGFMGSGKTSVGEAVAKMLGWEFVDLDQEFVRLTGCGISQFFADHGEAAFRSKECELLETLPDQKRTGGLVLALGGGTLESPGAVGQLRRKGGLVLLSVDPEEAWARVEGSDRPLAADRGDFDALWARRKSTYESCADIVMPVAGRDVEEVAGDIAALVRTAGEHWGSIWGRRVATIQRSSLVLGGKNALDLLAGEARSVREKGASLRLLTDRNVMDSWGEQVSSALGLCAAESTKILSPGETTKSVRHLEECWEWLAAEGARRDDVLVALGGGVVGDLGGFVAATYHRGVSLWQVPTSLLAQVDSSVGGKTAVNLAAGKNLVGSFYQPDLVIIDPQTLRTLPDYEYRNGLGEVAKHALLISEEAFRCLEAAAPRIVDRDLDTLNDIVKTNVNFKAAVVEDDERESGRRAVLNLGHTTAHALEAAVGYGTLGHGHAVALGLLVALAVSERTLGLDRSVRRRTGELLAALGLPTSIRLPRAEAIRAAMAHDKKAVAGSTGFVGLRAVGQPVWGLEVPLDALVEAMEVIED